MHLYCCYSTIPSTMIYGRYRKRLVSDDNVRLIRIQINPFRDRPRTSSLLTYTTQSMVNGSYLFIFIFGLAECVRATLSKRYQMYADKLHTIFDKKKSVFEITKSAVRLANNRIATLSNRQRQFRKVHVYNTQTLIHLPKC